MDRVFLFIFTVSFYCAYATIEIKELTVPNSIEYTGESTEEIILDCNFEAIGEKRSELELIWYHNGDTNPIYQWIPESNKSGEARGVFRNHLDLEYYVSDKDTMYRALKLTNINTNLTGNYTCKVSSLINEDKETKQLIIYSPAVSGIEITLAEEEHTVECSVQGVFPRPNIDIYISGENDTRIDVEEETDAEPDEFGFYNVTTRHSFDNTTFSTNPVKFVCDLNIPGTNYNLSASVEYYTEVESTLKDYNDEEDYYSHLNESYSSTEESSNKAKDPNSAMVRSSTVCLPAALMALLLLLNK